MFGSFIEKSSSASSDSSALCYLCWQWHHLHTMCWQYFANATMWVAALSNIIPTLLAAAVFQHYWQQQQSLNWQQSEFPLLVTLLPPSHQSAHSSDHGLTRDIRFVLLIMEKNSNMTAICFLIGWCPKTIAMYWCFWTTSPFKWPGGWMSSTGKQMQWEKSKSRNACSGFVPQADFFYWYRKF